MLEIIKSHFSHITQKEFETDIKLIPLWIRKLLLSLKRKISLPLLSNRTGKVESRKVL